VHPGQLRVAFVGEDAGRDRVAATLASWAFGSLCDVVADADVVVAEVSGTPGEQRRRGRTIVDAVHGVPVVLLTPLGAPVELQRLLETGARGVVLAVRLATALAPTLLAVASGQVCAPVEAGGLVKPRSLTRREKDVMTLVVMGLSNADIARRLHVGETTVKSHVATSLRKLGVRSRSEATELLLDPDDRAGTGVISMGAWADVEG
jgi:DNA-binding NarL/FixJ family response regulator